MAHPYEKKNHKYTAGYPSRIGLSVNKATKTKGATLKIPNPLSGLPTGKVFPGNKPKIYRR
jgi:hypothetical protein